MGDRILSTPPGWFCKVPKKYLWSSRFYWNSETFFSSFFLYPLKTLENQRSSYVFRRFRKRTVTWMVNESWYFQNFNAGPEYMRRFIWFGTICAIQKKWKTPMEEGCFTFSSITLLKVTLLHGCFSRFLNCTNHANCTKSGKTSHILISF